MAETLAQKYSDENYVVVIYTIDAENVVEESIGFALNRIDGILSF